MSLKCAASVRDCGIGSMSMGLYGYPARRVMVQAARK